MSKQFLNYQLSIFFLLFLFTQVSGQNSRVFNGRIIDALNLGPIPGVNIGIAPTTRGTQTDSDGYFSIQIMPGDERLLISHINYADTEFDLKQANTNSIVIIELEPQSFNIPEVVVRAKNEKEMLTDEEAYSTVDFIVTNQHIFTLNYHGLTQGYRLQLQNLNGQIKNEIKLKGFKFPQGLYLSCQDVPYLVTRDTAYQFFVSEELVFFVAANPISLFERYVKPCFGISQSALYYQFARHNGLLQEFHYFNLYDQSKANFRKIGDFTKIRDYYRSRGYIYSTDVSYAETDETIPFDDVKDYNEAYRNKQEKTDYLKRIHYKLKIPIFAFSTPEELVIFNHQDGTVERYNFNGKLLDRQPIEYHLESKWEEVILHDGKDRFYTLFRKGSNFVLYEINPLDGQLAELAQFDRDHYDKILIRDQDIYMLANDHRKIGTKNYVQRISF